MEVKVNNIEKQDIFENMMKNSPRSSKMNESSPESSTTSNMFEKMMKSSPRSSATNESNQSSP